MRIGFIGLGKLGYPVALAMASRGHDVVGYDIDPAKMSNDRTDCDHEATPLDTGTFADWRARTMLRFGDLATACDGADIVFVAVQTPHQPHLDGTHLLTRERADFDTRSLESAVRDVLGSKDGPTTVVVISTVLPGTMKRLELDEEIVYNPYFIAMGTVISDFFDPEFLLIGGDRIGQEVFEFYSTITDAPVLHTDVTTAEMIKVAYNTWISLKLAFINTYAMIAQEVGANVDVLTTAMKLGTRRLLSTKYLSAGMGDGGACHPRDNIALSWLCRRLGIPDLPGAVMESREGHALWLARIFAKYPSPRYLMGVTFKRNLKMTDGSPALLMWNALEEMNVKVQAFDPIAGIGEDVEFQPGTYFLGADHDCWEDFDFRPWSVILDPWGRILDRPGVTIVRIGRGGA